MTLSIEHIEFTNFRNYERFELNDIGALTLFVGPNAVGKTNIVEGIQLMTALSSFRHPLIDQVIKHGESYSRTEARVTGDDRVLDIVMLLESHKRKYTLNGKARRPADLKGLIPSVSFTPDDLDLVKGSMSVRRAAIDALGSQLSPNHYLIKKDYEKVIRYKNRLLKEEAQVALIDSINETLVTCGAQLACYRAALFAKLAPEISRRYADIAQGEKLQVTYVPSWMAPVSRETPCGVASFSRDEARVMRSLPPLKRAAARSSPAERASLGLIPMRLAFTSRERMRATMEVRGSSALLSLLASLPRRRLSRICSARSRCSFSMM